MLKQITMMQKMKLMVLMLAVQLLWVNPSMEDDTSLLKAFQQLAKRFEELRRSCQVRKVAFSASLMPTEYGESGYGVIGPFSSGSILIHGHIITNIGDAYNPRTGRFIAPVKGIYFFTFTTHNWLRKGNSGASLYRNQVEVLEIWEHQQLENDEDYATNSAVVVLEPGDNVYLYMRKGFQVASSAKANAHTFSGFLLNQL